MVRDGNRFIINISGRGYNFVASVAVIGRGEPDGRMVAPRSEDYPEHCAPPVIDLCNGIEAVVQIERRESKWTWQRQRLERKLHQDRA